MFAPGKGVRSTTKRVAPRYLGGVYTFDHLSFADHLAVLDRWLAPDHRYFKVRGDDGGVYILRHDAERDVWELTRSAAGADHSL